MNIWTKEICPSVTRALLQKGVVSLLLLIFLIFIFDVELLVYLRDDISNSPIRILIFVFNYSMGSTVASLELGL